jgi:hypothetical protein
MDVPAKWTPRSQRLGRRNYDGPFEGVPEHLRGPLIDWLQAAFVNADGWRAGEMRALCMRLRIPTTSYDGSSLFARIRDFCGAGDDSFLDAVEGAMQFAGPVDIKELEYLLLIGGSNLTVSPTGDHLTEVVGGETQEMVRSATAPADEASGQLAEAWSAAFGRDPDASDAWDHAIKAVEAVLRPVVEPNNAKATLGSMIAVLNGNPAAWQSVFPGKDNDNDVTNLVATLRLVWPNTDRHGGGGRLPSIEEARAVATLAATIVQWHREGWVVQKR